MKSVNLSVLPNYVVWFVGVDVEFVLSCRSDPLGRDVELVSMLHDHLHNVLAIGAAVSTEAPDMNAERPHHLEETPVSLCLHEAHVRIAVTVLKIGYQPTAKPQVGVDYGGQNRVEFVQDEKYSAKSGDFLRFFAYLCHVIDDFCLS